MVDGMANMNLESKFPNKLTFLRYITHLSKDSVDKNELITMLCRNKKVLDIGCIDHSAETAIQLGEKWLHKGIKNVASELTGLDVLEEDISILNNLEYNIIFGDAEDFHLQKTYEVIVAGDIIEHLSNIGFFLRCVKEHMDNESLFIFTTPNPFNIEQSMSAIFNKYIYAHSQHTCWLSPQVCWELLRREKLKIIDFYWIETRFQFSVKKTVFKNQINHLSRYLLQKNALLRRDFAVVVQKAK